MAEDNVQYETHTATVVRGLEARSIKKWEGDGWELISQEELPMLRTQLKFRRVKPKPPWLALAGLGAVIVVLAITLVVMNLVSDGDEEAAEAAAVSTAAASAPQVSEEASESEDVASDEAVASAEPADTYAYEGPRYEVVVVDGDMGPANLDQYWIYIDAVDGSTDAYKDQMKAIIEDIAHEAGTDTFIANIVTDREIALAEASSTVESFIDEYGDDYFVNDIPEKEVTGWVVAYSGGIDYNAGEASDADSAFEIMWWPYGDLETEEWRPVIAR